MKKLLFIATLVATLSISACGLDKSSQKDQNEPTQVVRKNANETPIHEKYVEQIKKELSVSEKDDYCYTYQVAEPRENNAYIIDFYVFASITSVSTWFCIEVDGNINCDMIRINHYN